MANINSYTDEFKTQIVALYQNGKSVSCLVKENIILQEQLLINESNNLLIQAVLKLKIIVLLKRMN